MIPRLPPPTAGRNRGPPPATEPTLPEQARGGEKDRADPNEHERMNCRPPQATHAHREGEPPRQHAAAVHVEDDKGAREYQPNRDGREPGSNGLIPDRDLK